MRIGEKRKFWSMARTAMLCILLLAACLLTACGGKEKEGASGQPSGQSGEAGKNGAGAVNGADSKADSAAGNASGQEEGLASGQEEALAGSQEEAFAESLEDSVLRLITCYTYDGKTYLVCAFKGPEETGMHLETADRESVENELYFGHQKPWKIPVGDIEGEYPVEGLGLAVSDYNKRGDDGAYVEKLFTDWSDVVPESEYSRYGICNMGDAYAFMGAMTVDIPSTGGSDYYISMRINISDAYIKEHVYHPVPDEAKERFSMFAGDGTPIEEFVGDCEITKLLENKEKWEYATVDLQIRNDMTFDELKELMKQIRETEPYAVYTDPDGNQYRVEMSK